MELKKIIETIATQRQVEIAEGTGQPQSYISRLLNLESSQLQRFEKVFNYLIKDFNVTIEEKNGLEE